MIWNLPLTNHGYIHNMNLFLASGEFIMILIWLIVAFMWPDNDSLVTFSWAYWTSFQTRLNFVSSTKTPFHLAILTKVALASEVCPVAKSHLGDSGTNKIYAKKIRFNEAIEICNKKKGPLFVMYYFCDAIKNLVEAVWARQINSDKEIYFMDLNTCK